MITASPDHRSSRPLSPAPPREMPSAGTPWAALILTGAVGGILSGLFAIGGAIISVPLLGAVFGLSDVIAKGTALLVSIPTSLAGTISNRRGGGENAVDVRAGLVLAVTAAGTSVPAVYLAVGLPSTVSSGMLSVLLIAIAVQLAVSKR